MFARPVSRLAAACAAVGLWAAVARGEDTLLDLMASPGSPVAPEVIYSNNSLLAGAGMNAMRVETWLGGASATTFDGATMTLDGFRAVGPVVKQQIGSTVLISQAMSTGSFSVTAADGTLLLAGTIGDPYVSAIGGGTIGGLFSATAVYTGGARYDKLIADGGATRGECSFSLLDISPAPSASGTSLNNFSANLSGRFSVDYAALLHWKAQGSGSWGNPDNWSGPVPSGMASEANFTHKITSPITVTLDGDRSVRSINFATEQSCTIAKGSGGELSIVYDNGSVPTGITSSEGNHFISAPLRIAQYAEIRVSSASKLTASGPVKVAAGAGLALYGGAVEMSGGLYMETGAKVTASSGQLRAAYITGGTLEIRNDASVVITAPQFAQTMVVLDGLTMIGNQGKWDGTLDIGSSPMQVRAKSGVDVLEQIVSQIVRARHGQWAAPGITSSMAKESPDFLGLAAVYRYSPGAPASDLGWIVVRCTYNGDANLDGMITADDYFLIDSGYVTQARGWSNGDFNYDGVVNADDYFLIDSAYIGQKAPLAGAGWVVPIPEPAAMLLAGLGLLGLRRSRR